jgi:hypothetical protein
VTLILKKKIKIAQMREIVVMLLLFATVVSAQEEDLGKTAGKIIGGVLGAIVFLCCIASCCDKCKGNN